jgi:hypothetical protein
VTKTPKNRTEIIAYLDALIVSTKRGVTRSKGKVNTLLSLLESSTDPYDRLTAFILTLYQSNLREAESPFYEQEDRRFGISTGFRKLKIAYMRKNRGLLMQAFADLVSLTTRASYHAAQKRSIDEFHLRLSRAGKAFRIGDFYPLMDLLEQGATLGLDEYAMLVLEILNWALIASASERQRIGREMTRRLYDLVGGQTEQLSKALKSQDNALLLESIRLICDEIMCSEKRRGSKT